MGNYRYIPPPTVTCWLDTEWGTVKAAAQRRPDSDDLYLVRIGYHEMPAAMRAALESAYGFPLVGVTTTRCRADIYLVTGRPFFA